MTQLPEPQQQKGNSLLRFILAGALIGGLIAFIYSLWKRGNRPQA